MLQEGSTSTTVTGAGKVFPGESHQSQLYILHSTDKVLFSEGDFSILLNA